MNNVRKYILIFTLLGLTMAAGSIAFYEHSRANELRKEATWLRAEIRRVQNESEASKIELVKLRAIVLSEKESREKLQAQVEQRNAKKK